jgi:hypothetical protein
MYHLRGIPVDWAVPRHEANEQNLRKELQQSQQASEK